MSDIESFHEDLFQEVVSWADADGVFKEDSFFDIVCDYLIEAGEFPEAERSYFFIPTSPESEWMDIAATR